MSIFLPVRKYNLLQPVQILVHGFLYDHAGYHYLDCLHVQVGHGHYAHFKIRGRTRKTLNIYKVLLLILMHW